MCKIHATPDHSVEHNRVYRSVIDGFHVLGIRLAYVYEFGSKRAMSY
jgi:hypothetical protein